MTTDPILQNNPPVKIKDTRVPPSSKLISPPFETDSYYSELDFTPVIHIDTVNLTEDINGPLCRIYLNDECIYENPVYPLRQQQ